MSIAFKNEFSIAEPPETPLALLQKVQVMLPFSRSVTITRHFPEGAEKKTAVVNSFRLTTMSGPEPAESKAVVAQAIADVMHWTADRALANGEEDTVSAGIEFTIKFLKFDDRAPERFKWVWNHAAGTEGEEEEDDLDDPELVEGSHRYLHAIIRDQQRNQNELIAHLRAANKQVLEGADRMAKPLELVAQQLSFANGLTQNALNATVHALQMRYSTEAQRTAEEAKDKRWSSIVEGAINTLGPAVSIGAQQLMSYLASKATGEPRATPPRGAAPTRRPTRAKTATPKPASEPVETPAATAQPATDAPVIDEAAEKNPLTHIIGAFGMSLQPAQRKILREAFSSEQLDSFDELLGSENDEEVVTRYRALEAELGQSSALMDAVAQLDEDQQQLAMLVVSKMMALPAVEPE